jgi:GTP cyclohydrolase II
MGASAHHRPSVGERIEEAGTWVELYGRASLPTRFGTFDVLVFRSSLDDKEHVALLKGDVCRGIVPTRVHSECLTGDVLGSLRCDCRDQLELTLQALGEAERGVLLYLRQEGRGIGLGNKIRAYALQEQGMDTVEANEHLGFDDDLRDYRVAAMMLKLIGVKEVELATNNPRKMFGLRSHGVKVSGRRPLITERNPHNSRYLETKAKKAGHILPLA